MSMDFQRLYIFDNSEKVWKYLKSNEQVIGVWISYHKDNKKQEVSVRLLYDNCQILGLIPWFDVMTYSMQRISQGK